MTNSANAHILKELVFPARYEFLIEHVGSEVARLVVAPPSETLYSIELAAQSVRARGEGLFVPMYALSGTGKTTLASNLRTFLPSQFSTTVQHNGAVSFDELKAATENAVQSRPANDERIIPLLVDHRESAPADTAELAAIKRFLRDPLGRKVILCWPETSEEMAKTMSADYERIAGRPPISLPLHIEGPRRDAWVAIATDTLQLSNNVESLELLGVDPRDYDPAEFETLGAYLRAISDDFTRNRLDILQRTRLPIRLAVVVVSASTDPGVLMHLTNSSRFGFVDGNALLAATPASVIGKWWAQRRGLLTQMIVQLDARVFGLPPSVAIPILRRFGPESVSTTLASLDVSDQGVASIVRNVKRSDFGKYLLGIAMSTYETRGTPSSVSSPAFDRLAERGFTHGADKELNKAVLQALKAFLEANGVEASEFRAEEKMSFTPLIPDTSFILDNEAVCLEYTWRSGDYLTNKNRAAISAYILGKLQNYARELGYVE
ncbi:hypothetical protein OG338_13730 [Streptomyces sp. NBC_00726]|uniref:hypothetical protein n=1 Tax=Streptomyces sp. NBC_00726 TaxID=2903674 RepID=UPI003867834A